MEVAAAVRIGSVEYQGPVNRRWTVVRAQHIWVRLQSRRQSLGLGRVEVERDASRCLGPRSLQSVVVPVSGVLNHKNTRGAIGKTQRVVVGQRVPCRSFREVGEVRILRYVFRIGGDDASPRISLEEGAHRRLVLVG